MSHYYGGVANFKIPNPPWEHIDGLMQDRRNSISNAHELRHSSTKILDRIDTR